MEKLIVTNFLVIKEAKFNVGRVNVIIGPQANGKSILVKLLYFFREVISEKFLISIKNNESKVYLIKQIEELFEKYFPKYTWKDKSFKIIYNFNDIQIKISKNLSQRKVQVELCDEISTLHRKLKSEYKKFLKIEKKKEDEWVSDSFWDFKREHIYQNEERSRYFSESLFIPASRSFFANLQKNIFSFLSKNIDIDPFMNEFGSKYEFSKKIYSDSIFHKARLEKDTTYKKIQVIVKSILNGDYKYKDDQDWIESNGEAINLSNASSGQQESLPMLLILSIFPFMNTRNRNSIFFIEEPEAHLFPVSQKHIVSLIGLIYNMQQNSVITTHSPYILTAINNLLLAYDVMQEKGENSIDKIIDKDSCINFDDIQAYTIKNGKLISIMNKEERLIGINIIDSVSEEFNGTFDSLLALQI